MSLIQTILVIAGSFFIFLSLLSLIYQIFSASFLALVGIIFLNFAYGWFNWYWLILFFILVVVASLGGFLLTLKASTKLPKNRNWVPIIFGVFGAILIPLPFLGTLIGVFTGTLLALLYFPKSTLNREKVGLALEITFKSFLGLVLEITCMAIMAVTLVLLIVF